MKISELIKDLEKIKEEHGDLSCFTSDPEEINNWSNVDIVEIGECKCNLGGKHCGVLIY